MSDATNREIRQALDRLTALSATHGQQVAALMLLTGASAAEIEECGGVPK